MKDISYTTSDLTTGAFLLTEGFPLSDLTVKGRTCIFHFCPSDRLTVVLKSFQTLTATVEPNAFGSKLNNLKHLIHMKLKEDSMATH